MNKDVTQLRQRLHKLGYTTRIMPSGHLHIFNPEGKRIVSMSATPRKPGSIHRAIKDLRHAGVPL